MKKFDITTITVNPSLDKSAAFNGLVPEKKIRCTMPHYDAGGGGINVSKAIARLGGESLCIFTSGGSSGSRIESLLRQEKIEIQALPVRNWTRENFVAFDSNTNLQYRFGFPGCSLSAEEKETLLASVRNAGSRYIVASGSLNEGLPTNFYQKMASFAKESGSRFIVDTSGEALAKVLQTGVYLAKPNIGELAKLVGVEKLETAEATEAAKQVVTNGSAHIIVVSLGSQGAILVSQTENHFIAAPNVPTISTVGAGDSMVGGMVWALSQNKSLKEVLHWGVACGSAATMNSGTQLFKAEDAKRLFNSMDS